MAWTPLTNLAHARLWEHINNLATQLTADFTAAIATERPKYAGTEVSIAPAATNPPAGTVKIVQDFTKVCTTESAGGGFVIALPTAFPHAVMGAVITVVTSSGGSACAYLQPYPAWSKTQLYAIAVTSAGAGIGLGASVTVSVHAWGW